MWWWIRRETSNESENVCVRRHASKVVDTFYDIGVTFARQFENNSMRKLKFELRTVLRQIETPWWKNEFKNQFTPILQLIRLTVGAPCGVQTSVCELYFKKRIKCQLSFQAFWNSYGFVPTCLRWQYSDERLNYCIGMSFSFSWVSSGVKLIVFEFEYRRMTDFTPAGYSEMRMANADWRMPGIQKTILANSCQRVCSKQISASDTFTDGLESIVHDDMVE